MHYYVHACTKFLENKLENGAHRRIVYKLEYNDAGDLDTLHAQYVYIYLYIMYMFLYIFMYQYICIY